MLQILAIILAGLCLIRVFSVAAAMRDVETYSATEESTDDSKAEEQGASDEGGAQAEIKLSTPAEAAAHVADDSGAELVPGVERLRNREDAENAIIVPRKVGRSIAAQPNSVPPEAQSPVEVRPEAAGGAVAASPTSGRLSTTDLEPGVIEPRTEGPSRPFTREDALARGTELHRESIPATSPPVESLGLRSEPAPDTRINPPLPDSATARAGVQEVSLIVSDYGYFPSRIFVTQGVPVKVFLTTPSKVTMCFMADNFGVKKGIAPGHVEEVTFMPQQPGDYRFYCPVRSIQGTITVREPVDASIGRAVASAPPEPQAGHNNEPKRAPELRSLIED